MTATEKITLAVAAFALTMNLIGLCMLAHAFIHMVKEMLK